MPDKKHLKISFVIITGGVRRLSLQRLLFSIERQNIQDYETLIVGNTAGIKNSAAILIDEPKLARTAAICKMRNMGAAKAKGELIVLLDDDIEFADDWYRNLENRLNENFDLAGCRVVTPAGERWYDWTWASREDLLCPTRTVEYHTVNKNIYISGCFMMVRKHVFEKIRFDENLLNHQRDDVDFCHRAWDMGFEISIFPEAHAIHHLDPSGRSESDPGGGSDNFAYGIWRFRMGEYEKALEIFNRMGKEEAVKSKYHSALCHIKLGQNERACDELRFVIKNADLGDMESRRLRYTASYHLGRITETSGDFAEAIGHYQDTLNNFPEHFNAAEGITRLTGME